MAKKTLVTVPITQAGAGVTEIVPALGNQAIWVVSYVVVLSATGTLKFTSAGNDKSGAMDIAANGGLVVVGDEDSPVLVSEAAGNLSITTTVGAAKGHLTYFKA